MAAFPFETAWTSRFVLASSRVMVARMQFRDTFLALMAMRKFVGDLSPDQAHLFHRIAARYQGSATAFRDIVMREFSEGAVGRPSLPVGDLEIRAAMAYALGRQSVAVSELVDVIKQAWPDLHPETRAVIASDIEVAIAERRAGGASEIALWKMVLALAGGKEDMSIEELRSAAAQAAYESHDFGEAEIEDADGWERTVPGDIWTRAIYVRPTESEGPTERGHFTVVFKPGSADVRECYGILNGELLRPAAPSPR
jgi:hypothetical protein